MENEPWMENELWMENEGRMVDLDIEPEMIDLLNNVASRIDCDNWMVVGVLLNIPCYELYNIKHKNSIICLLKVFRVMEEKPVLTLYLGYHCQGPTVSCIERACISM